LPQHSDNPDHPSTLPQPDLNPLLNPILAKNIGRWAEVYFTNPPEKREQALQELVRELERENPVRENAVAPEPLPRQRELESGNARASTTAEVSAQGLTCHACGYVNRPKHKFCGRCGMRIAATPVDAREEQYPQTHFLSLQSPENSESPVFGLESPLRWQVYRLYGVVALAFVVSLLGYMAWRGVHTSGASHVAPHAPQTVTNPVASTPPPSNPKPGPPSQTTSAPNKAALAPTATAASPRAPSETDPANSSQPVPVPTSAQNFAGNPALVGDGSEELAIAREILSGESGRLQNHADAVPWVWKAVAKQNVAATVLLAGLYLRGDGVAKSCEQAHLLLDAAALKGRRDAAELLRNLQAFGCQ